MSACQASIYHRKCFWKWQDKSATLHSKAALVPVDPQTSAEDTNRWHICRWQALTNMLKLTHFVQENWSSTDISAVLTSSLFVHFTCWRCFAFSKWNAGQVIDLTIWLNQPDHIMSHSLTVIYNTFSLKQFSAIRLPFAVREIGIEHVSISSSAAFTYCIRTFKLNFMFSSSFLYPFEMILENNVFLDTYISFVVCGHSQIPTWLLKTVPDQSGRCLFMLGLTVPLPLISSHVLSSRQLIVPECL